MSSLDRAGDPVSEGRRDTEVCGGKRTHRLLLGFGVSGEERGMWQPCHSGGLDSEEQGHWALAGGRGNLWDSVSIAMGIGAFTAMGVGKSDRYLSMDR